MSTTIPQLDPVQQILPTDVIMVTHTDGTTEKITGADLLSAVTPVDVVEADNMQPVTSNAVAECLSYSTSEHKTGEIWLDGKPIYRRVIPTGALPNNGTITINSPIQNLEFITDFRGIAVNSEHSQQQFPKSAINLYFIGYESPQQFGITTEFDASDYTGYIIVEYTKTTDSAIHLMSTREFIEPMLREIVRDDRAFTRSDESLDEDNSAEERE